ncbi:MAG: hypothetical protein M3457_08960 [Chloroflexota bacterium]|nr:hypothetical protein [Chloroflexota bacterium]
MFHRIRGTDFTWDPDRESRGAIWDRIKRHIQLELDRISEKQVALRSYERRRASPVYERNIRMLEATGTGTSVRDIARTHGLRPGQVREIVRMEANRRKQEHWLAQDIGQPENRPTRHLDDMPVSIAKTSTRMRDP